MWWLAFADDAAGLLVHAGLGEAPFPAVRLSAVALTVVWTVLAAPRRVAAAHLAVSLATVGSLALSPRTGTAGLSATDLTLAGLVDTLGLAWLVWTRRLATDDQVSRLREAAHRDELTGVLNRRGLDAWLAASPAVPGAADTATVVCLDLDGLKSINDTRGHAAGDAVLRALATALADQRRAQQEVARLGGDEFVFVSRSGPPNSPEAMAGRVLGRVAERLRPLEATVTGGVAVGRPGPGPSGWDGLFASADRALAQAKGAGWADPV